MPARPWLRYPPRIIRQTRTCPSGEPRFPDAGTALGSVPVGARIQLTTTACQQYGGVHLVRPEPRRNRERPHTR